MVKTKELKKILTGNVMLNESNVLIATPPNYISQINGAYDGWLEVMLFGVRMDTMHFVLNLRKKELEDFIDEYMSNHGRRIELKDNPGIKAIFTGFIVSRPMVVAFEIDENGTAKGGRQNSVIITVCTGRSLLAGVRCKRIFRSFAKYAKEFIEKDKEDKDEK